MIDEIIKEKLVARPFYLEQLKQYLWSPLIKVIVGQRRVGKSTLLKQIIQYLVKEKGWEKDQIFYMNKEFPEYDQILSYKELNDLLTTFLEHKKGKCLIAIDEIQEIQNREKTVNGFLSKYTERVDIIITGSNSNLLSGELSTHIAGRYIELPVYPLSYSEFLDFQKKENNTETFSDYLCFWGLPALSELPSNYDIFHNYLRGVYNTIVLKDIISRFTVKHIDFFETLYRYVFANIGNIFSAKSISDYLKSQKINISVDSVLNYLAYGEQAFILHKIKSQDPKTKKFFTIYNKYYVGDLGIRNSLVGYQPAKDIGGLLENYVYLLLKKWGFSVSIWKLSSWKEIDFIAEKYWKLIYLQVSTSILDPQTLEREYAALEEVNDNWEKLVVTMDAYAFWVKNGIKHYRIEELESFLTLWEQESLK